MRAAALGLPVVELDTWYDVDDAVSLRRLCVELASASVTDTTRGYSAPATTDCLARGVFPSADRRIALAEGESMSLAEPIIARRYFETVSKERSRIAGPASLRLSRGHNRCNLLCETVRALSKRSNRCDIAGAVHLDRRSAAGLARAVCTESASR